MAFPVNTLVIDIFTNTQHGQWSSRVYLEPATGFAADQNMQTIANSAGGLIHDALIAILGDSAQFAGTKARYYGDGIDIEGYSDFAQDYGDGPSPTTTLPAQDCLEVRRLTGKPGRKNRGRMFFSGIAEGMQQDGVLDPARYSLLQDLATQFSTDWTLGGQLCHHRHYNRVDNSMVPVTTTRGLARLVSRRDRAKRLPYQAI